MKTYEVMWQETITYNATIEAESEDEVREILEAGEADPDEVAGHVVYGSLEIKEA